MKNSGLVVLSLFDGMSCGRLALDRAGIKVKTYYSSEIDKYAIKVADDNWPEDSEYRLGDITKWKSWDIDWSSIDLVLAGSPCQGFSFAGKQLAFDDPRSKLYFEFENIINKIKECNPKVKFLLENVRMKKESLDTISNRLEVEPILINSALVSAQNRQRYYWCNWDVVQPKDKNIYLKDIIEGGYVDRQKDFCLDANYFKGGNLEQYFNKSRRQLVFESPMVYQLARGTNKGGIRAQNGKVPCLSSSAWEHNNKLIYKDGIRKFTPIECERLQTVPDNYTSCVSNSQRYKMLGNGWTVDVIVCILSNLK